MLTEKQMKLANLIKQTLPTATNEVALQHIDWYPEWHPDIHVTAGDRLSYDGVLYRCLQEHDTQESWTPVDAPSLWAKVLIPNPDVIPDWEQPDSTNPYSKGDKVVHNGKTWESLTDNNVWEPGATGTESLWREVAK
ncbi:carbohydrate-binding protein [Emergencia sp. JLR.KK010]|uniref:carbohydrate-binding protein n=1 Tax=Emergencia sp. JLR.KK010 TaxID=3114296 RepID=UPI0030D3EF0E